MEDILLIEKLRENPRDGLRYVIDQYMGLVYSIVKRKISKTGNEEDIKECVSDVFLGFYNQINKVDLDKGSIKGYLAMIANNKSIDFYRKLKKNDLRSDKFQELKNYEDYNIGVEKEIIKKEEKNILLNAIKDLGEPDSEIFIRKYYMGQKTKEIANVLDLKDNTVDKKISRGLKRLRVLLGGEAVEQ